MAAVVTLFAYNGLVIGVFAASLPTLKLRFGLDATTLAILFLTAGVGAIASMQVSGRLADRSGARHIVLTMIVPLAVAIVGVGFAPTYPLLLAAGFVLGVGNGGIDVAMNALAVQVEQRRAKPIMSFFHGTWSIGNLVGAGSIVLIARATGWGPEPTVLAAATAAGCIGAAAFGVACAITPQTERAAPTEPGGRKPPVPRSAYLLGLMAIAFGISESAAGDWSAVHVTEVAKVDPVTGSLGVTAVAAFMVLVRLFGDALVARFGRRTIVRAGAAGAITGLLVVSTMTSLPLLLLGWALVGFGGGIIAPQVYAVAGYLAGGRGLAVVVTFGYATFLITPAILGALVGVIGVQHAMFVPAALLVAMVFLARILPAKKDDPAVRR